MLYPKNQIEFEKSFSTDKQCLDYLFGLKYEQGFKCSACSHSECWVNVRGILICKKCKQETSIIANTVFHGSRIPIHLLFRILWFVVIQKVGVSALSVQKILGIKRYATVWEWPHKFRRIMVLPSREKLSGIIEVDETFVGGTRKGKRGRGAEGKLIVIIAVELVQKHTGRIRVDIIENADRKCINEFLKNNIQIGSTIVTDGWAGYADVKKMKYNHQIETKTMSENGENLTPHVHKISSLLKRWLLGTHQNYTSDEYLAYYLDEYAFRYNRRNAKSRGLLFYILLKQAILNKPVYHNKNDEVA